MHKDKKAGASRTRLSAGQRRESILEAAADVFAARGYRAAKMSDVAAKVGVTEPVIFQNFGSKAALFVAVVERAAVEARASMDELTAGFGSPSGLLAHVLTGSAPQRPGQAITDHSARHEAAAHAGAAYGVLFAEAATLTAEPELTGPGRNAIRAVAAHLTDLIQRAQAKGEVRPGTDPEAAAWLLLSVLSASRMRAAAMPEGLEPAVTALALQALAPPAAGSRDQPRPP